MRRRTTHLRIHRLAVVSAFVLFVGGPTVEVHVASAASVKTWSLATDFAAAPSQANPNPDLYGNAAVWSFRQSATLAHTPADYTLLPTFIANVAGLPGLNAWQRSDVVDDTSLPSVGFNSLPTDAFPYGLFRYPARTTLVHPYESRLAVVAWRSPVSGTVKVTGGIIDRHAGCGDGVNWSVDKGGATLASGAVSDGGTQAFSGAALSSIAVAPGDLLYFIVGPGAGTEYHCDSTGLDVTLEHTLAGGETLTTLAASATPSVSGQPVAFTATVAGAGATAPAGAVQFQIDGANAGVPVALDSHGAAVYSTSALSVGAHAIRALFQPSGTGVEASRASLSQRVDKAATTTAVLMTPNPSVAGQNVTVTTTVSAVAPGNGVPTGTVQFSEGDGTPIGPPQALTAGKATLVASADAGSYTLRANYSGDDQFNTSSSGVGQTVNRANTTTTITSDTNPVAPGGQVTFTVTVTTTPPGGVQPAGTIAILIDGENASGPVPLFDDGPTAAGVQITFTAPTVPRSDTIGAVYSGDWNTYPSSSPTFVQTVATPASTAPASTTPASQPSSPDPTTAATTTAALSAMTSPLTRALKRRGFAALDGATETLTATGPGTLTQQVYTPTAPASVAIGKRKPVLIASARHTFAAGGEGKLTLRLTTAGRRAIRRAKSLKLEIVTRFVPRNGTPVTAATRLTVKARPAKPARAAARRAAWTLTRIRR